MHLQLKAHVSKNNFSIYCKIEREGEGEGEQRRFKRVKGPIITITRAIGNA